jgi:hypothetical protein
MYKPSTYSEVTYFLTYLPMYETLAKYLGYSSSKGFTCVAREDTDTVIIRRCQVRSQDALCLFVRLSFLLGEAWH